MKIGCIVTYKFSCVQIISTYVIFHSVPASLNNFTGLGKAATWRRHTFGHVTSAGWLWSEQVTHKLHGDLRYNLHDDYLNQFFTIADRRQILTSLPLFEHDAQNHLEIKAHNNILLPLICLKINHHFREGGSFHWEKHESTCSNNSVILWSTVLFQGSASHQATKSGSRICNENKIFQIILPGIQQNTTLTREWINARTTEQVHSFQVTSGCQYEFRGPHFKFQFHNFRRGAFSGTLYGTVKKRCKFPPFRRNPSSSQSYGPLKIRRRKKKWNKRESFGFVFRK